MAVDGVQAEAHGDHGQVGPACSSPGIEFGREVAWASLWTRDVLRAELLDRPAEGAHAIAQSFPGVGGAVDVAADEDEAVRETGGSIVCRLGGSTEPDRDGLRRPRHECGSVDPVEPAREVDDGFGEELAEQSDLLLLPRAASTELLTEGLVLDVVPADPNPEARWAGGEKLKIGCLPCHERCLALREDQNPGGELDSFGDGGQIGEHHERVVERVVLGIRPGEGGGSMGGTGPGRVVVGEKVAKPGPPPREPEPPHRTRIASK